MDTSFIVVRQLLVRKKNDANFTGVVPGNVFHVQIRSNFIPAKAHGRNLSRFRAALSSHRKSNEETKQRLCKSSENL